MEVIQTQVPNKTPQFPHATLQVRRWSATCHPSWPTLTDPIVEKNWLPTIGPTATVLIRRLGRELATSSTLQLCCADWAESLGVGHKGGYHSPFWRALRRAEHFGIVHLIDDKLLVKVSLPPRPGLGSTS